jgi:hypothetical protein
MAGKKIAGKKYGGKKKIREKSEIRNSGESDPTTLFVNKHSWYYFCI